MVWGLSSHWQIWIDNIIISTSSEWLPRDFSHAFLYVFTQQRLSSLSVLDTAETEINFTKHCWENQLLNYLFTIRAMDFLAARSLVHWLEDLFLLHPGKSNQPWRTRN